METKQNNFYSDKLAWGLTLLAASMLAELAMAGYGLANLGMDINPEAYASGAASLNPIQVLVSCLSPLSFLLKIIAIVLIVQDSARLNSLTNGLHRKLAWVGAILFAISLLMQIGTTLLSFNGTFGGSLTSLHTAMWISMAGAMLGFAALILLSILVIPPVGRGLLIFAAVLYLAATGITNVLTIQNTSLESYDMMGNTFFVPELALDRTQGMYPILAGVGTLVIALTFVIFLSASVMAWRSLVKELPESVA